MTSPNRLRHIMSFSSARRTLGALALAAAVILPGCKKEEPPPPPPPPPPPVIIPDPVDIQAIRQELGADARVQIARGVETTERDIAEAVIRFADAWAKGDASNLRAMLSQSDRAILDDLRARGEWDPEIKTIEQVRIVYLNQDGIQSGAESVDLDEILSDQTKFMEFVTSQDPQAMMAGLEAMLKGLDGVDPALMEKFETMDMLGQDFQSTMREFLATPQGAAIKDQFAAVIAAAQQSVDGPVVTLALQQPAGAYVLAWHLQGSPGNYTFASLHTIDTVRRRASEWDGQAGLAGMVMPDAPETPEGEEGDTEAQPEEEGEDTPFGTPGRKNTPAGPVTIPGGA